MREEAAFWLAVALVSIASSVLIKVLARRLPFDGLKELAAAS